MSDTKIYTHYDVIKKLEKKKKKKKKEEKRRKKEKKTRKRKKKRKKNEKKEGKKQEKKTSFILYHICDIRLVLELRFTSTNLCVVRVLQIRTGL